MRRFIECILEVHHQALADHCDVNIGLALDREAQLCYEQAQSQVARRCRGKRKDAVTQQRLLVETLSVQLTQALSAVNLRDPTDYAAFTQAVQRWCPWQVTVQHSGRLIQQILLALLPEARQKQQLEALCEEYQQHLTAEIEGALKQEYPAVYANYQKEGSRLFGAPPFECGEPRALDIVSECHRLERFVAEQAPTLQKPSLGLASAIQKYQAVSTLANTLKTPIKPVHAQLADFRRQFPAQQAIIAKDRDSIAVKCVKSIATVLSLGLAALWGIWGIKGKAAANDMACVLAAPAIVPARGELS